MTMMQLKTEQIKDENQVMKNINYAQIKSHH